jgi:hypothetical protein
MKAFTAYIEWDPESKLYVGGGAWRPRSSHTGGLPG